MILLALGAEVVLEFTFIVLLFPVFFVIATPYLLVASAFKRGPYRDNLARGYQSVYLAWRHIFF